MNYFAHHFRFLIICACITFFGANCVVQPAKGSPSSSKSTSSLQSSHFKKARIALGRDWYIVYAILDRLSRSNNLDRYPWRVTITDEYETQAYASEDNLVAVPRGVLEIAIAGDTSTLACIIAHEIAHHTLEHRSKIPANYFQRKNDKIRELEEKLKKEEKRKKEREETIRTYERNLAQPNMPSWLKNANEIGLALAKALPEPKPIDPEKLKQELGNQLDADFYANLRSLELEADREGFTYTVRAGFDKEGCINLFNILARTTASKIDRIDGRHPTVEVRKNQILQLISPEIVTQLIKEGKTNRTGKNPLSYELNKNLGWLRVNTRMGSALNDFNRLFNYDN